MIHAGVCSHIRRFRFRKHSFLVVCALGTAYLALNLIHDSLPRRPAINSTAAAPATRARPACPPPPPPLRPAKLPHRFPGLTCAPRHRVGFLKTHRSGSSAVQNVLFRLAAHHQLVPLLPAAGSQLLGRRPFRASDRCAAAGHQFGCHIINVALRWDHDQVQQVMPNDTVYISIVREPLRQFLSMFRHLELDRFVSLEEFAAQRPIPSTRFGGMYGRNQQLWDFGLPEEHHDDDNKVAEIERHFQLVLVAERMDESLVLLRHLLCWPTAYVVSMRLNALMAPIELPVDSPARSALQRWLRADRLLYRHFAGRLEQRVRQFGEDRMRQEVAALREETRRVVAECRIVRSPPAELQEWNRWPGHRVYGFSARNGSRLCQMYVAAEHTWVQVMRELVEALKAIR
ncbi:galactose-3-O-sulfotransferase 4-like isoform X2 [Amphibalanus amphitrite]|uniref:galactose-3-O-sulfotransferase 4-like isoform X2 n=1 Tax=Amphibalanus amphitrite TaxID=1232801 RepID=UPI001C90EC4F|nr:galactose-3-O-sulfotransferase 4-like isoform X2 [Amphibalanus amphitrite]